MLPIQDQAAVATVNKLTYGASGGAVILGLSANEAAAIGGLIVAIIALFINAGTNWYFKSQHLKLAKKRLASEVGDSDDE